MADQNFIITIRVTQDNAQANGASTNIVEAYILESETMLPATKLDIVFSVNGNAIIKENNSPLFRTSTDGNGKAVINITNTVSESITVKTYILNDPNQLETKEINFLPTSDKLKITSIHNRNHTFTAEQPTIAWAGASFTIETTGGSGDLDWKVEGAVAEVDIESLNNSSAGITIKSHQYQAVKIVVTDKITSDHDDFSFFIKLYIAPSLDKTRTLSQAINLHDDALLSPINYLDIHKEWGDLTVYPQWSLGTSPEQKILSTDIIETDAVNLAEFWTNEYSTLGKATVANIKDGTFRYSEHGSFTKHFHAYRSGRNLIK
ncbi:Ig-like domain-containing protein [Moellerella wisconsensis]|uniref:Ig-like domain-containing protein n=2 Tax=Moellerella wisconsensis TaxID=158849 RepID=A0ACD3YB36_9GAMM|nr:Ig-like domain-containing protein [Moellerella wisconsensis]KLN96055.1 hypothetical protein VK86_12025 [Moellerella wisconsensis]UNH25478.1 Ig-like domain-containing protein [Moellerella wisconsensis]UNH28665.1 Ig-like domain-containing protein [Moellerella wisconsensis]UNH32118.1 Ig-like domain-containing protein [Moellerella wisconsensis]UNH40268.1 Ig-like domain-containing protein [Moellerella wisconsensis]